MATSSIFFDNDSSVEDICEWLDAIGLGAHTSSFSAHGLTGEALMNVTSKTTLENLYGVVGTDSHTLFEAIKASQIHAEDTNRAATSNSLLVLTPAMSRALQRNIILPAISRGRGGRGAPGNSYADSLPPPLFMRALLYPCGYRNEQRLWIHDVDLARETIVIVNHSAWSIDLGHFQLCNEESRQKFG